MTINPLRMLYYPICGDCRTCKEVDRFVLLMMLMIDED